MINEPLLRKTLDVIRSEHQFHVQGSWITLSNEVIESPEFKAASEGKGPRLVVTPGVCGTAACFAGWAVHLAGWEIAVERGGMALAVPPPGDIPSFGRLGQRHTVEGAATHLLGLDYSDAEDLFNGSNSLCEIEDLVDDLIKQSV